MNRLMKTINALRNLPEIVERCENAIRSADKFADAANGIDAGEVAKHVSAREIAGYISASDIAEKIDTSDIAECFSASEIAEEFSASDIAYEISTGDIADHFSVSDIAEELDISAGDVADEFDTDEISRKLMDRLDIDDLADRTAAHLMDYKHEKLDILKVTDEIKELEERLQKLRDEIRHINNSLADALA